MNTFDNPNLNFRLTDYLLTNKTPDNKLFNKESIEKHSSEKDCYVAMNGKVYDMSKYYSDLKENNKSRNLGIICGTILDINPTQIFKEDNYNNYEIGYIEYYLFKKFIYLIVLVIIFLLSFYLGFIYKTEYNIIFKIIAFLISIKLMFWILYKYQYTSPLKYERDYIS